MTDANSKRDGALSGVAVLDISQSIGGPYCAKLLAGLGADVIKIEEPGTGDCTRRMGPFANDIPDSETSGAFLILNMGKRGITLNLQAETGRAIFRQLIKDADILIESSAPGFMESLGLSYAELEAINPGLVMTSITAFGQSGPYRDYKATDIVALALGGLMYLTGDPGREPLMNGGAQAEYQAGLNAFVAALGALYYRDATGAGQHIDVSTMESIASITESAPVRYSMQGLINQRVGNWLGRAAWGIYPCRDGSTSVVSGDGFGFRKMRNLIPELADPLYDDPLSRSEHADEINAYLLPWLMERDKIEIYHTGQSFRLPFGYVATTEELIDSPQLQTRGYFVEVDHPKAGRIKYPGAPFKMTETPWQVGRAPLLGEHNEEVYQGKLGYAKQDLVRLRERGII